MKMRRYFAVLTSLVLTLSCLTLSVGAQEDPASSAMTSTQRNATPSVTSIQTSITITSVDGSGLREATPDQRYLMEKGHEFMASVHCSVHISELTQGALTADWPVLLYLDRRPSDDIATITAVIGSHSLGLHGFDTISLETTEPLGLELITDSVKFYNQDSADGAEIVARKLKTSDTQVYSSELTIDPQQLESDVLEQDYYHFRLTFKFRTVDTTEAAETPDPQDSSMDSNKWTTGAPEQPTPSADHYTNHEAESRNHLAINQSSSQSQEPPQETVSSITTALRPLDWLLIGMELVALGLAVTAAILTHKNIKQLRAHSQNNSTDTDKHV